MKIEGLVVNVTAVGSPDRAESEFWNDLGQFWTIQAAFVVWEPPLCDLERNSLLSPKNLN